MDVCVPTGDRVDVRGVLDERGLDVLNVGVYGRYGVVREGVLEFLIVESCGDGE